MNQSDIYHYAVEDHHAGQQGMSTEDLLHHTNQVEKGESITNQ